MFAVLPLRAARPIFKAAFLLPLLFSLVPARADDGKMTLNLTPPLPSRLTYWFARDRQQTEPLALPEPKNGQITLSVPSAYCKADSLLKILDTDHKRVAHLPVNATVDGAAPKISETNLLFSSVWGVAGLPDADRAHVMDQWRGWLRTRRLAQARGRKVADGKTSPNLLQNADFNSGLAQWNMENSRPPAHADVSTLSNPGLPAGVSAKAIRCNITAAGTESWHLQFVQAGINVAEGTPYTVSFWARADHARKIVVSAALDGPPWSLVGMYQTAELSAQWKQYSLAFLPLRSKANHTRFAFAIADATGTVDIAAVSLRAGVNFEGFAAAQAPEMALAQNDFQFSQAAAVSVTSHGLGAAEGRVTLRSQDAVVGTYELQPSDNGAARFTDVPLNLPLKFTVSAGGKTAEFTRIVAEDKPNTTAEIALPGAWRDVKTVAAAVVPAPPSASAETPSGGGNSFLWAALGVIALSIAGVGGYLMLNRKPQGETPPVLSQAIVPNQASLGSPNLRPTLRFPENHPVGAMRNGKALPEALPERAGTSAQLVAIAGKYSGAAFPLAGGSVVIGRDANCDVPLPLDTSASRRHAEIRCDENGIEITDNASSNGTFVNGVRLPADTPRALRPGDEIEIGASRFRYES